MLYGEIKKEEELYYDIFKVFYVKRIDSNTKELKGFEYMSMPEYDEIGYPTPDELLEMAVRSGYNEELDGVITVICENPLNGIVIRYGNHGKSWQKIGEVIGYA